MPNVVETRATAPSVHLARGPVASAVPRGAFGTDHNGGSLRTALAVHKFATKWNHTVTPSKRLKKHAQSGTLHERAAGGTYSEAVDLVDASVAHQRRIRLLFTELEAAEGSQKSQQSEKDEDISPIVQAAWHEVSTQALRVLKKTNELRNDGVCEDTILPVRTVQQMENHCLSVVAVLKSHMTTGVRVTAPDIVALMTQARTL